MKLFILLVILPVTNWIYESPKEIRESIAALAIGMKAGCEDCRELIQWQLYKYELRMDSFPVTSPRMVLDSTVRNKVIYDTTFHKGGYSIKRTDSTYTRYKVIEIQDTTEWHVKLPTFEGFMEWKLKGVWGNFPKNKKQWQNQKHTKQ